MQRPSLWPLLVLLLLGLLFLREPRFQRFEEVYLRWLERNSLPSGGPIPLTVVEIGGELAPQKSRKPLTSGRSKNTLPLDLALFLQGILDFKPTIVAIEPVLDWSERDKEQEQIFIDQAMHVPKLLLGAELTATPDLDAPVPEIAGFTQVIGKRGDIPEFSGIARQPSEDVRVISTLGFVNLPREITNDVRAPLLFQYRGEVIPSFALQAALLWLRIPLTEVKIEIGSAILLPNGMKIPIRSDGTALVNLRLARRARHVSLNELLLVAQQHETGVTPTLRLDDLAEQLVLARMSTDSRAPDFFAATIAAIQSGSFVRRVSWIFDCVIIVLVAAVSRTVRQFSSVDVVLAAIAVTAGYCLLDLAILSRWSIWLPGCLPMGAVWVLVIFSLVQPKTKDAPRTVPIAAPPPAP
jgi:CHASE2 domain